MDIINIAHAGVITDAPSFKNIGLNVLFFLLSVAGIIAIIGLVISGVRYFFANGDTGMMETAKKSAKYSLVGVILAMGGMILIKTVGQFF
jgi:hypothetical protein